MQRHLIGLIGSAVLAAVAVLGATSAADPPRTAEVDLPAVPSTQAGPGCAWIGATARPIGVTHFQDPKLQQTTGVLVLRRGSEPARHGAALATIVGQDQDGALRGNHHFAFGDGVLRTRNDRVALKPTADKCRFEVEATINVADGSGAFAGSTGTLDARGTINMCGGAGQVSITGKICKR